MTFLPLSALFFAICGGGCVLLATDSELGSAAKLSGYTWLGCGLVLALVDLGMQAWVLL